MARPLYDDVQGEWYDWPAEDPGANYGGGDLYYGSPAPPPPVQNPEPQPAPAPPPAPGPAPAPGPSGPPPLAPFDRTFQPPPMLGYPSLPSIPLPPLPQLPTRPTPPPFQFDSYAPAGQWSYQDWTPPSVEQALSDPSYQFRKQQGEQSLQNWAAARGTLNDSGTANALIDYGQNAASQEYSNIWNRDLLGYTTNRANSLEAFNTNEANRASAYDRNRALAVDTYNTNYRTQYEDPYRAAYTAAIDTWIPNMEGWRAGVDMSRLGYTTESGRVFDQNQANYNNAWNVFLNDYDRWKDERDTGILLAGQ